MTGARGRRATDVIRAWPVLRTSRPVLAFFGFVELVALVWCVVAVSRLDSANHSWAVLALLTGLALVFEESARRAARLQLRLSSDMKRDMTSV